MIAVLRKYCSYTACASDCTALEGLESASLSRSAAVRTSGTMSRSFSMASMGSCSASFSPWLVKSRLSSRSNEALRLAIRRAAVVASSEIPSSAALDISAAPATFLSSSARSKTSVASWRMIGLSVVSSRSRAADMTSPSSAEVIVALRPNWSSRSIAACMLARSRPGAVGSTAAINCCWARAASMSRRIWETRSPIARARSSWSRRLASRSEATTPRGKRCAAAAAFSAAVRVCS